MKVFTARVKATLRAVFWLCSAGDLLSRDAEVAVIAIIIRVFSRVLISKTKMNVIDNTSSGITLDWRFTKKQIVYIDGESQKFSFFWPNHAPLWNIGITRNQQHGRTYCCYPGGTNQQYCSFFLCFNWRVGRKKVLTLHFVKI